MDLYTYSAYVKRVVDGDTVDLDIDLGLKVHTIQRIRVHGIDAPETYGVKKESQEYQDGLRATERLKELIEGKEVLVQTIKDKTGKYGRYLADIYINELSVATILLEEGLVKPY